MARRHCTTAYRVDKGGQPTWAKVMRAAELLKKHKVEFNILTTVHAANMDHPLDVYRFLRDEVGTQFIQFIPIIERVTEELLSLADCRLEPGSTGRAAALSAGGLAGHRDGPSRLKATAGSCVRSSMNGFAEMSARIYVQLFDVALASWVGQPNGLCVFSPTCGTALAVEHNGDLYSCDHYVEPDYLLGNINDTHMIELVALPKQRKFGQDKLDSLPQYCLDCEVRFVCNGGCPKNRFIYTPGRQFGPQLSMCRLSNILQPH